MSLGSWKLAHSDSTLVQLVWAHAEGFGTLAHAGTFYDLRQLRKRDAPLLEKMYQKALGETGVCEVPRRIGLGQSKSSTFTG